MNDKELFIVLLHAALSNPEYEQMPYYDICVHIKTVMMPVVKEAMEEYE